MMMWALVSISNSGMARFSAALIGRLRHPSEPVKPARPVDRRGLRF
jgi:hypothetical protein